MEVAHKMRFIFAVISQFSIIYGHRHGNSKPRQIRSAVDSEFRYSCENLCGSPAPKINTSDIWASTCSCERDCSISGSSHDTDKTCCPDYFIECENKKSWLETGCEPIDSSKCSSTKKPVILISLDGFRVSYLERIQSKSLNELRKCGVKVPFQRSSYPTVTFPNHFTIATGHYPESHGIIDNSFNDLELNDYYNAFDFDHAVEEKWYQAEPIWNTVTRQNKISAAYMWPSSDLPVQGKYPSYVYNFSTVPSYQDRIVKVLEWIDLGEEKMPDFMAIYMDEPDHTGHDEGPDSNAFLRGAIEVVDNSVSMLMEGLIMRGMENCVDLVVVADHGMSANSKGRRSFINEYFDEDSDGSENTRYCNNEAYCSTGCNARIGPNINQKDFNFEKSWNQLKCSRQDPFNPAHWKTYKTGKDLPKRLHYHANSRIDPIVMSMDDSWYSQKNQEDYYTLLGNHGYDNLYESMRALFVGYGPSFKENFETEYVHQNIELYHMCPTHSV